MDPAHHATGDRAMRQVVDLYAKIMAERPAADLRWTVEHSYLPLEAETRTVNDMARHGIIASVHGHGIRCRGTRTCQRP